MDEERKDERHNELIEVLDEIRQALWAIVGAINGEEE